MATELIEDCCDIAAPTEVASDDLVRFLLRPESYPEATAKVSLAETHISWVFLTDTRVYKLKKPVRFPFLDYSTLDLRQHACEEEVRLNSRLAPGVYLGVVPISASPRGGLCLYSHDRVADYCVKMQRLPAHLMLDRLIRTRLAPRDDIERLVDILVRFYDRASRGAQIERYATASAIERQARENLATMNSVRQEGVGWAESARPTDPHLHHPVGLADSAHPTPIADPLFQRVRASQLQFLNLSAQLFAERIRSGRICEGHGDLRPEHVCMTDPPVVFDCVEFSLPLRAADVISELAFLAMECDFLGAPELGTAVVEEYKKRSGDQVPDNLTSFYKSYRACIRAKVELLRATQQTGSAATGSRTRARRYLQLASFYATEFYRPQLFVMVGAAGSGKSSVAEALADALGLQVLRTDAIRHELAGRREPQAEYRQGLYSDSMTFWTYETLFDRAETLLREAVSVVLDGTFRDERQRDRAVELAHRYGSGVHFLFCHCPADMARSRIAQRIAQRQGISDARPDLVELQEQELRAAKDWADRPVLFLDTSQPVAGSVVQVMDALRHHLPS